MVRFIILSGYEEYTSEVPIYIPIWLDLLYARARVPIFLFCIYIPIWLDLLLSVSAGSLGTYKDLHSNMVRFIINSLSPKGLTRYKFTFQYG